MQWFAHNAEIDTAELTSSQRHWTIDPDTPIYVAAFNFRAVALLEMSIFFACALIFDQFFHEGLRFRDVQPHPFWILVLTVSMQYGTNEGLAAAIASSFILLFGNMPDMSPEQDVFDYFLHLMAQPMWWVGAALLVGEIRRRQVSERDELKEKLDKTQNENKVLTISYHKLAEAKERLESNVAGQFRTAMNIFEAAKGLERLGSSQVMQGIANLVQVMIGPERFSVFLLQNGVLEAVLTSGWSGSESYPRSYQPNTPLFHATIVEKRVLCISNTHDEEALMSDGLLAGTLHSSETGETVGMLKVETMEFTNFTHRQVENFRILCEWVGTAYVNARLYEQARENSIFNPELNLLAANFYDRQVAFLRSLAQRLNFDVSSISLRLERRPDATLDEHNSIARIVGRAVTKVLRATDLVFESHDQASDFTLVLAGTPLSHCQLVAGKLFEELRNELPMDALQRLQVSAGVINQQRPRA